MQATRGRPKRDGNLHRIYLRDHVLATWNMRKDESGWGNSTHNEFAEFLIDSLQGIESTSRPTSTPDDDVPTTRTIATQTDNGGPRRINFSDKSFVCSTPLLLKKRMECIEER